MDLKDQIKAGLQSQGFPIIPTGDWIQTALLNRTPVPPLPALVASARARLLAADLTNPQVQDISTAAALPANLGASVQVPETRLPRSIVVQVLDVENLSRSKWEQVEELEAVARGEQTRGREIIRLPTATADDEDAGVVDGTANSAVSAQQPGRNRTGPGAGGGAAAAAAAASRNSTHRLVLQDCRGQKVYGLELRRIERIALGTLNIGEKILLREGAVVARGVVLLDPASCTVLGGKVDAWQKAWNEGRLARLKEAVGIDR